MSDGSDIRDILADLIAGEPIDAARTEAVFNDLFEGRLDDAQIGSLLALIQVGGVTVDELVGAARAMRARVTRVPYQPAQDEALIDTCGTGGAAKTFNISTAAAIVVSAVTPLPESGLRRVVVAKHGNRSRTGRGSAESLAVLGVNVDAPLEAQAACLAEVGVCFCFAVRHHPAMKHAVGPRKSLGFPTIFNLLGPLTNPAGASRQLIGVYRPDLVRLVGRALAALGTERAVVVHGAGGLDEVSTLGPSEAVEVADGLVRPHRFDPKAVGLIPPPMESLQATDVEHAAAMVRDVLAGVPGAPRDIVLLNAAAALFVAGACDTAEEGMRLAAQAVDTGLAAEKLARLVEVSQKA